MEISATPRESLPAPEHRVRREVRCSLCGSLWGFAVADSSGRPELFRMIRTADRHSRSHIYMAGGASISTGGRMRAGHFPLDETPRRLRCRKARGARKRCDHHESSPLTTERLTEWMRTLLPGKAIFF